MNYGFGPRTSIEDCPITDVRLIAKKNALELFFTNM